MPEYVIERLGPDGDWEHLGVADSEPAAFAAAVALRRDDDFAEYRIRPKED